MKQFAAFILAAAVLLLFSTCKKNAAATGTPAPADTSFKLSEATLLKQGAFSGNMSYAVSGAAKLYEYKSKKYLYLENYNGSSGPDLRVYI